MRVWICNGCQAEIPEQKKPDRCPLCGQYPKGFEEGERKDPPAEDKKYSDLYKKTLEQLEKYDDGCEPQTMKYCCDE